MLVNATQTDRDQWFEGDQTVKGLRVRFGFTKIEHKQNKNRT